MKIGLEFGVRPFSLDGLWRGEIFIVFPCKCDYCLDTLI
jgi:hypothetical protein